VYESLLHGSLTAAYDDMLTAAQKRKKSLSAWSLATKLTGSYISISNKQKKPPTEGEIMCLLLDWLSHM